MGDAIGGKSRDGGDSLGAHELVHSGQRDLTEGRIKSPAADLKTECFHYPFKFHSVMFEADTVMGSGRGDAHLSLRACEVEAGRS